jgi:hypothetical protein
VSAVITLAADELRDVFGFGVAGNFAGHLEQAGEAADFVTVVAEQDAPKGIFPWYVPGQADEVPGFLHAFPLSSNRISFPAGADNLQIEPEVGLLADVTYGPAGTVTGLTPVAVAAFNDCSIRRPGANKISEKKNWGAASKGLAGHGFAITDLSPSGPTANFRLVSFLVRDGAAETYGVDSAVPDYSYYGTQLLDWTVERLTHQLGAADTPLEPVGNYLRAAASPARVFIGIGATRYTPYGASTYLRPGDDSVVVVYDSAEHTPAEIATAIGAGADDGLTGASVLRQRVSAG